MVGYASLLPSAGLSLADAILVLHLLGTVDYSSQLFSHTASQGLRDGHFAFHFSRLCIAEVILVSAVVFLDAVS